MYIFTLISKNKETREYTARCYAVFSCNVVACAFAQKKILSLLYYIVLFLKIVNVFHPLTALAYGDFKNNLKPLQLL